MPETARQDRPLHPEARWVVEGAIAAGTGQGLVAVIGMVLSVIIPRLFGAGDYGLWVMYRSIVNMVLMFCTLGAYQTIVCHYIPWKTAGREAEATSLLKSLAAVRLAVFFLAALVSAGMLLAGGTTLSTPMPAALIALSVLARGLLSVALLMLYGDRRIREIFGLHVLLSLIVPGSVAAAYVLGDVRSVPLGCAAGDCICAVLGIAIARPWRLLGAAWLKLSELRPILLFGTSIGISSILNSLFMNMAPYFMALRNYSAESLAYVGISIRMAGFVIGAIGSVSSAVIPTFSAVMEKEGGERVLRWNGLLTRLGFALILCVLGNAYLLADRLVPLVWGAGFAPMADVMVYSVASLLPLWLASQMVRYVLFFKRSLGYLFSRGLQLGIFLTLLFAMPGDSTGQNTLVAMILASVVFLLCASVMYFRRIPLTWSWMRHIPAILMVWLAYWLGLRPVGLLAAVLTAAGWTIAFALVVLGFGAARLYEIRDILGLVTSRRERGTKEGPAA